MTSQCRSRRRPLAGPAARRLAVAGALLLGCGTLAWAVPGGTAQAAVTAGAVRTGGAGKGAVRAEAGTLKDAVTFIGDSVTAGFGYCGVAENASGVSCTVNQPMANSWYLGDNSLFSCAPPSTPDGLNDACSNNNNDGKPWNSPPWSSGPGAPLVAYPYQIAASQSPAGAASVSDWAVSGSTPANWDPAGGEYGPELKKLTDHSWIQLNDTWIHPNQSGAAQLAGTVTAAMCADFQHWCGTPPAWG